MKRNSYNLTLTFNKAAIVEVVISQHYREKHSDHMNDETILELVRTLDGQEFLPESEKDGFQYFALEPVIFDDKPYRLVLVTSLEDSTFLGVINAFRVRRKK